MGFARYLSGQFEEAVDAFRRIVRADWTWAQGAMGAAYAQLGQIEKAQQCAQRFLANVSDYLREQEKPVPDGVRLLFQQEWADHYPKEDWFEPVLDGLAKAGFK